MLDIDHPQAKYIFDAMGIQSRIKGVLHEATTSGRSQFTAEELESINIAFLELEILNLDHFDENPAIQQSLDDLKQQFNSSAPISDLIPHLLKFTDQLGDNFGTWSI
jgi:hypothetical protein